MGKFEGKRLLILGSNNGSVDIVNYAQREGAYVIVTDYLPTNKSAAKKYADETAQISTVEIDALVKYAKEKKVDGVFCGVSETNLRSVREIAERLNLPCYFTKEQWNLCQLKDKFKELCKKHGVPVAKEFEIDESANPEKLPEIKYPVIVKPVDLGASRGIHICYNAKELQQGYRDALEKSLSHKVIVEQYLTGDEISATYTFIDGECRLSMLSQMYYNCEQVGMVPLPDAYIYPSQHLEKYKKEVDPKMIEMLKSTGLKNGSVFVTGIATGKEFAFFEAGLRIAGTIPYVFVSKINGINIMELMTEYAINGRIEDKELLKLEDPNLKNKKCCLFSLLNGGGVIHRVEGIEEAERVPGVIRTTVQRKIGDTVIKNGTLGQIHIRFYIIGDTLEEIRNAIKEILKIVKVTDINGKNMLLRSVAADEI